MKEVFSMTEINILQRLADRECFKMRDFFEVYYSDGGTLGEAALRKRVQELLNNGYISRIGRGIYCVSKNETEQYKYDYSELSCEVANIIKENHPYLNFTIFEQIQLNEFVNHQLAHNVIFLSIEDDLADFVFDTLKEVYPEKVLLNPTLDIYHQYWYDNMIVIGKLITEAPKGIKDRWHTRIEKLLVDIVSEPLIIDSLSAGEYPTIYEEAFRKYVIDESCLFRYAKRRSADKKIRKIITEKTNIKLKTKE